ncbi:hypothetical protein J8J14_11900 [Roseomonas sp. SSH11]|uniref:Uncharacterized protein n=1 Tax=Pararoseomonas baculiformis TaxID=2820812 RepID=A0ABS4AF35_9PROT|nr:hypothetical protein [Pararoseomonas baculiformis]MBP0445481.1 hypothetical protein [Pararoseomonas baculiformis]
MKIDECVSGLRPMEREAAMPEQGEAIRVAVAELLEVAAAQRYLLAAALFQEVLSGLSTDRH